jgi:acetyl/propionyl-CoA carboxylase alpha subunit
MGGSAPKDSYLRWERIIEAARATGAQAIHPGYGFLSENEDFAKACAAAGLVFIGPPARPFRPWAARRESKQLMEKAGVPLVPGYHGRNKTRPCWQARGRPYRLPGADQGQRRRRWQGHARGGPCRRLCRRAGLVQARSHQQLWRRRMC